MSRRLSDLVEWCKGFVLLHWSDFERICRERSLDAQSDEVIEVMIGSGFEYRPFEDVILSPYIGELK